jgi:hypothetical protein
MLVLKVIQLKNVLFKREIKSQNIWNMDEKGFHFSCGYEKKGLFSGCGVANQAGSKEPRKCESSLWWNVCPQKGDTSPLWLFTSPKRARFVDGSVSP